MTDHRIFDEQIIRVQKEIAELQKQLKRLRKERKRCIESHPSKGQIRCRRHAKELVAMIPASTQWLQVLCSYKQNPFQVLVRGLRACKEEICWNRISIDDGMSNKNRTNDNEFAVFKDIIFISLCIVLQVKGASLNRVDTLMQGWFGQKKPDYFKQLRKTTKRLHRLINELRNSHWGAFSYGIPIFWGCNSLTTVVFVAKYENGLEIFHGLLESNKALTKELSSQALPLSLAKELYIPSILQKHLQHKLCLNEIEEILGYTQISQHEGPSSSTKDAEKEKPCLPQAIVDLDPASMKFILGPSSNTSSNYPLQQVNDSMDWDNRPNDYNLWNNDIPILDAETTGISTMTQYPYDPMLVPFLWTNGSEIQQPYNTPQP